MAQVAAPQGAVPVVVPAVPPSPFSGLYARWTLDCVVEAVLAVAHDFVKRPRQYRDVDAATATVLENFRYLSGTDPAWPNAVQRAAMATGFFGPSDAKPGDNKASQFHQCAAALRAAAVAYSERVHDSGEAMLRQAYVDAARALRAHVSTLEGRGATLSNQRIEALFGEARTIVNSAQIAAAFGVRHANVAAQWPVQGLPDGDVAVLLEEITRTLQPASGPALTQQQVVVLQRVAHYGAATIQSTMALNADPDRNGAELLLREAYSWATALRALGK